MALQELFAVNVVRREDMFITTKIARTVREPEDIRNSIDRSLEQLQLEYIDLVLIHSPHSIRSEGQRGRDVIEMYVCSDTLFFFAVSLSLNL